MNRRRFVFYLLLNVFVTALVAGTFLYIYDRTRPQTECPALAGCAPTLESSVSADILNVTSAGVLASEMVTIQNSGDEALEISGWTLKDSHGNAFTFPQLTLFPGGVVRVHTGKGSDTASDLYWGRGTSLWKSGELAALYDPQNIARAFYRIP